MELVENTIVAGRFRLNRLIGRGGMASVWHATHLGLDTPCAVKFIEGELANLAEAHERFEREAKAAAQLRSPHVVQILDHGVWENTPFIAMELLDGEDLGKRLQRAGKMNLEETALILTQVCRALSKAHAVGIVHRDLKPDNIFLVKDDDREIAKVLDFGIAKRNTGLETGGSNTRTGAVLGTPYYMSPEQAQGTKGVDARSDLWSLAVIAFECVTGHRPFDSEALGDLLVKIIVSPLPMPSQFGPVPPGFDAWWTKAASRDPALRFQSAKEFAESLTTVLHGGQLAAGDARVSMLSSPDLRVPGQPPVPHLADTGSPMARTFAGDAYQIPKKSGVGAIAIAGGAVLLVALAGVGFMLRSKGKDAEAHKAPAGIVQGQEMPKAVASAAVASAALPEPSAPASASAQVAAASAAKPDAKAPEAAPRRSGGTSSGTAKGTSKPSPTPRPAAPSGGNLGF